MKCHACFLFVIGCSAAAAYATSFSSLIDFGDSLTDAGNDYLASGGTLPGKPGYDDGRFSNGPVWVEHVGQNLGLGAVTPSLAGGSDYAYGGVTSGTGYTDGVLPNVETQINGWTASHLASSSQLFTVLGGANDLFAVLDGTSSPAAAVSAADNISAGVSTLYNDGARNILVGNLPDLGNTPAYRATALQASATALTGTFDARLATDLATLQAIDPALNLYNLNLYALYTEVLADPGVYGITDTADQAYTGDNTFAGNGTSVSNPSGYLFWDSIHPTATTHSLIAQAALAVLPEPGSMVMVMVAAAALARRPRIISD